MEALQSVAELLQKCYGMLQSRYRMMQNITEHYRPLPDVTELYGNVAEALQGVAEHSGTLWIVIGCYRTITERYGTITENIDFAHL